MKKRILATAIIILIRFLMTFPLLLYKEKNQFKLQAG